MLNAKTTAIDNNVASLASSAVLSASNGLTKTGQDVALGGTLSGATSIANAGFALNVTGTGSTSFGGNVGIGTTAPAQPLDVTGNIQSSANIAVDDANTNTGTTTNTLRFGPVNSGEAIGSRRTSGGNQFGLDFYTTSTNRMSITTAGNVGIGTATPAQKLDVVGNIQASAGLVVDFAQTNAGGTLGGASGLHFGTAAAGEGIASKRTTGGNQYGLDFYTGNSARLSVGLNGNVGIGTTAPNYKLEVNGTQGIDGPNVLEFGAGVTGKEGNAGKIGYQAFTAGALDIVGAGTTNTNRRIRFFNEGGAGFNGNVGIGTSAPSQALDVSLGSIRAGYYSPFTAVTATNRGAHLQWNRTGGDGETWLINHMGGGSANAGIRFAGITTGTGTVPTEWARFLNNGNFGIGTTAPATKLDVNGNFRLAVRTIPVNITTPYTLVAADIAFSVFKVTDGAFAPSINLPAAGTGQVAGQELTVYSTAGNPFTINAVNTDNTTAVNMPSRGVNGIHAVKYIWDGDFSMWMRVQ